MSANLELVKSVYAAFGRGDIPAVLGAMAADIVWNEAENFPYADGNPYVGPQAVLDGVFARLGGEWNGFTAAPTEFLDAGDTIVALGRYGGAYKATGASINAQFSHVWRVRNGKLSAMQQYTDTLQAARVVGK